MKNRECALRREELLFWVGALAIVGFMVATIVAARMNNFEIFRFGSLDFWQGRNPYTEWDHTSITGQQLDRYLYGPLFSLLFTPFALLPMWLGATLWGLFNYLLLAIGVARTAVWRREHLLLLFFFTITVVVNSSKAHQYNSGIAGMFLLMLSSLEEERPWVALTLLVVGALTKVYVAFGAILFLFYPHFWHNVWRGSLLMVVGLLLPALVVGVDGLVEHYVGWVEVISQRDAAFRFFGVLNMLEQWGWSSVYDYMGVFLFCTLLLPGGVVWLLSMHHESNSYPLRAMLLGTTMLGLMVWGNSTELVTYVIGHFGFFLWFYAKGDQHSWWDYTLLVLLGFFFVYCPLDFLCPPAWSNFILLELRLGTIFVLLLWCWMLFATIRRSVAINQQEE